MRIFYSKLTGHVGGQTPTSLRRMTCPRKKSSSSRSVLSRKDLKLPCIANQSLMHTGAKSPEMKKPICLPCVVVKLLRDESGGLYACSLIKWWSWILSMQCPMRPYDGH